MPNFLHKSHWYNPTNLSVYLIDNLKMFIWNKLTNLLASNTESADGTVRTIQTSVSISICLKISEKTRFKIR